MLVVHHTPIWTPLTAFTGQTAVLMKEILSGGLNMYVMRTNSIARPAASTMHSLNSSGSLTANR